MSNNKISEVTLWSNWLLWPTLIVSTWLSVRMVTNAFFTIFVAIVLLAAVLVAWWQRRNYFATVILVFIATSGLFAYSQNTAVGFVNLFSMYTVLIYVLSIACFATFATYKLKIQNPYIMVYLVSAVFICVELFWILSNFAADPIIKGVLVAGFYHITFTLIALFFWQKLDRKSFRWYVLSEVLFFAIFLRLL